MFSWKQLFQSSLSCVLCSNFVRLSLHLFLFNCFDHAKSCVSAILLVETCRDMEKCSTSKCCLPRSLLWHHNDHSLLRHWDDCLCAQHTPQGRQGQRGSKAAQMYIFWRYIQDPFYIPRHWGGSSGAQRRQGPQGNHERDGELCVCLAQRVSSQVCVTILSTFPRSVLWYYHSYCVLCYGHDCVCPKHSLQRVTWKTSAETTEKDLLWLHCQTSLFESGHGWPTTRS